jgi:hypothetical protein
MAALFCLFLFAAKPAQASLPDTYYFWIGPNEGNPRTDSFVIAVPQAQGGVQIKGVQIKGVSPQIKGVSPCMCAENH